MYSYCYYQNTEEEIGEVIMTLMENYPAYMQQPERLYEIMCMFKTEEKITMLVETEYVDRQFRDSYYGYFSQKFREIPRNCIRLIFFVGIIPQDTVYIDDDSVFENLIGQVVLRPLKIGNIGFTLLDPHKLRVKGYVQTCCFKLLIMGRKLTIRAFPFLSQDGDSMSCAETALFNLIQYYGEKYSEYRAMMPNEILQLLQTASYQRVLPSTGVDDSYMAKVLSEAHLYPRLYAGLDDFDFCFHTYVESGIPFILGLPLHAVICIGHGTVDINMENHNLTEVVEKIISDNPDECSIFLLHTSQLVDEYIFMDDNQEPYTKMSLNDITNMYFEVTETCERLKEYIRMIYAEHEDEDISFQVEADEMEIMVDDVNFLEERELLKEIESVAYDEKDEIKINFKPDALEKIKTKHNSLLVPLYRRIFLDATRAKKIFDEMFLCESVFLDEVRRVYEDDEWGRTKDNPIVWRMYLASSNSYREHRAGDSGKCGNTEMAKFYAQIPFPRFLWVLEMGTLETLKEGKARVEVILDATGSRYASTCSILSVGYRGHFIYAPAVHPEHPESGNSLLKSVWEDLRTAVKCENKAVREDMFEKFPLEPLTAVFYALYNSRTSFPDTYNIFCSHNLKEI